MENEILNHIFIYMKKENNTSGSQRRDIQIVQIKTTEKVVPSKKVFKRKPRNNRDHESN